MSRPISDLSLPHFLKTALKDREYETVEDLVSISGSDLAVELSIGLLQAEDILRQAHSFQAGPSRIGPLALEPEAAVIKFSRGSQLHSTTAAKLLQYVHRTRFSTMSVAIDDLLAEFAPPRGPQPQPSSQLQSQVEHEMVSEKKGPEAQVDKVTQGENQELELQRRTDSPWEPVSQLDGSSQLSSWSQSEMEEDREDPLPNVTTPLVVNLGIKETGNRRRLYSGTGALCPGMVLEVSGPPGSGKTCLGVALAISARIGDEYVDPETESKAMKTKRSEVLFIDTELSMSAEKVEEAALAVLTDAMPSLEEVLNGIHLMTIPSQLEFLALLYILDEWLEEHPLVKLIVVDTLTGPVRQPALELGARRRILDHFKKVIGQAATVHGCAVVVMTQMATRRADEENQPSNSDSGDHSMLMPLLGDSWTTERTVRLVLFRGGEGDGMRYAHATIDPGAPGNQDVDEDMPWAAFDIDKVGLICDIPLPPQDFDEGVLEDLENSRIPKNFEFPPDSQDSRIDYEHHRLDDLI